MLVNQIDDDAYVLIGNTYQANCTVFISRDEVLLVDAMASKADAEELREFVEVELKKRVAFIVSTHFFADHMAALNLFPHAKIIAHKDYLDTFNSELYRSGEEATHFREPDILVSDQMQIRWGKCALDIFHNPGHTPSTLGIDVKPLDLLMVGDTLVGNIVYLTYSTPERFVHALEKLKAKERGRVLSSHGSVRSAAAIGNAQFYLKSLGERTREAHNSGTSLLGAPLESFLPAGVEATAFEKIFHARNLNTILERKLFL